MPPNRWTLSVIFFPRCKSQSGPCDADFMYSNQSDSLIAKAFTGTQLISRTKKMTSVTAKGIEKGMKQIITKKDLRQQKVEYLSDNIAKPKL